MIIKNMEMNPEMMRLKTKLYLRLNSLNEVLVSLLYKEFELKSIILTIRLRV